jgi:hypothetical protein
MNSAAHFEAIVSEHCEALYRFALSLTPVRRPGCRRREEATFCSLPHETQSAFSYTARTRWQPLSLAKTGRHFGNTVEILSGLDANDSVVVDGANRLSDGQPLETK